MTILGFLHDPTENFTVKHIFTGCLDNTAKGEGK